MARLLAIDAATDACSVAVLSGDIVYERSAVEARAQSALLLPMVGAVLAEAGLRLRDLDALVVGRGPGSFTGVRLAVGVAQGLALGAHLPVIPISDLAMAAQAGANQHACATFLVCVDARLEEVYWCAFERAATGLVEPLHSERLSAPADVAPAVPGGFVGIGSGWTRYEEQLRSRLAPLLVACDADSLPHARDAIALAVPQWRAGNTLGPEQVLPVYLREQVASRPAR